MKTLKNFNLFKSFSLLTFCSLLFAWGCQKETATTFADHVSPTNLGKEQATLQMVYGFRPDELGATEAQDLYKRLAANLTPEQSNQLEGFLQQYQNHAPVGDGPEGLNYRCNNETTVSVGNPDDYFGSGIAKVGNTLFVGAPGANEVYVYNGTTLVQTLTPSNGATEFGAKVAASGQWLAVAAFGEVIMFQKQGGSYVETTIINPGLALAATGGSGADIALDANKLAILGRDIISAVIKVYKLQQGSWVSDGDIDLSAEDIFLWDIDMHANRIAANGGTNAGFGFFLHPQVYVFKNAGNSWNLDAQTALPAGYLLARAVAIDNSTVVANTALSNKNAVYTYTSGNLSLTGELVQPDPLPFAQTRWLDVKGSRVVVTVPTGGFFPESGDVAHVFDSGILLETITPSTGGTDYLFGESVLFDGSDVLIGAPGEAGVAGNVFIYSGLPDPQDN